MIYVFGLAFAVAILLAYLIKRAPLNLEQNSVHPKVTNIRVTSRKPAVDATSASNAPVRSKSRAPEFGRRTRDL